MRQLLDFIPLIIFFAVYMLYDIFIATQALIVATAITLIFLWFQFRKSGKTGIKEFIKAEKIPIFTFLMVFIFGSLTVYFHENSFIIWKVTIIYSLFAAALLISQFVFNKPIIQRLLDKEITLPQHVWSQINFLWAIFFIICGAINLYVGFNLSESTWITFKSIVFPVIMFVCTLCTVIYIYRFLPKEAENAEKTNSIDQSKHKD